jgi:hypothetical protein
MVIRVSKATKATRESLVILVFREILVSRVTRVQTAQLPAHRVTRVFKGTQVFKAIRVRIVQYKETPAYRGIQVRVLWLESYQAPMLS